MLLSIRDAECVLDQRRSPNRLTSSVQRSQIYFKSCDILRCSLSLLLLLLMLPIALSSISSIFGIYSILFYLFISSLLCCDEIIYPRRVDNSMKYKLITITRKPTKIREKCEKRKREKKASKRSNRTRTSVRSQSHQQKKR